MKQYLFAKAENGALIVDGNPYGDWARSRRMRGTVVYCDDSVGNNALSALVTEPDDYAFGPPGLVHGVSLRAKGNGRVTVYRDTAWGADKAEYDDIGRYIGDIQETLAENGWEFCDTAAQTVVKKAKEIGIFGEYPVPARWAEFVSRAIHVGPISHMRGNSDNVYHYDRISAFLAAMRMPMPIGYWYVGRNRLEALNCASIVYAKVRILHTPHTNDIGPLPVRIGDETAYPVGVFYGVWTGRTLREAVECDECEILEIIFCICNTREECVLNPLADELERLPKFVRKPLYTRFWGKLCSNKWWKGRKAGSLDSAFPAHGLWWKQETRSEDGYTPNTYRPDISATIVADNYLYVMRSLRTVKPMGIIGTHIDAVWIDTENALQTGTRTGDWRLEGTGAVRFYRPGTYTMRYADGTTHVGAMGWTDSTEPTPESVEEWVLDTRAPAHTVRGWSADPRRYPDAWSYAGSLVDPECTRPRFDIPPWDTALWRMCGKGKKGV